MARTVAVTTSADAPTMWLPKAETGCSDNRFPGTVGKDIRDGRG